MKDQTDCISTSPLPVCHEVKLVLLACSYYSLSMIEWEILDSDNQLPTGRIEEVDPPPSRWGRMWRWLLLLLLVVIGALGALQWQTWQQEEQIKADLMVVLKEEARSQAFGFPQRAADLADPRSPTTWYERYVDLFRVARPLRDSPIIEEMVWDNWRADVEVTWPNAPNTIVEQRSYRLVNGVWRRTPLINMSAPEAVREKRTTFFLLQGGNEELTAIEEDRDLRLNLEALRARVVTYWPETWKDYLLTLYIEPQELSPPVYFNDAQKLYINRVNLAQIDAFSPLPRKAQYRLAIVTAVVQWLTNPQWARELPTNISSNELPAEVLPRNDWLAVMTILQEIEARHWALHGWERRNLRNIWREELGGVWPNPFNGQLPINLHKASEEERKRGLAITLLIEQKVAQEGINTVGQVAQLLYTYPSDQFVVGDFFETIMGHSIDELEAIYGPYVLQPEEAKQ